jgi:hypothetical protein
MSGNWRREECLLRAGRADAEASQVSVPPPFQSKGPALPKAQAPLAA